MGGWGSGRQGGRVTIEGCGSLRLSISDLRDLMDDPPGTARWMQYSQNGEHRMTVVVEVRASHGYVRLQHPSRASDRTEHMDYTVGLIWTVPRFGGRRWWFSCPLSGRRCGVLYLPRGASKFASAKGHGLDYAVTRMTKLDQIWRRMARISGRLGGEPGPQGPPPRPDGMPAATYRRQLRLWREAEERLDALANARLGGLLPALAGLSRETAAGPASANVLHTNGRTGAVEWDVTADVLQALRELKAY